MSNTNTKLSVGVFEEEEPISFAPKDALGVPILNVEGLVGDLKDHLEEVDLENKGESSLKSKETAEGATGEQGDQRSKDVEEQLSASKELSEQLKNQLKRMYGDNLTISQEVNGEEVDTNLDNLELTPSDFANIISAKIQEEKKEEDKDKISIKGLSDFGKAIIEIEKKGGDYKSLLAVKEQVFDPLEKLDLSSQEGQEEALLLFYQIQNYKPEDIEIIIQGFKDKGLLEQKSEQAIVSLEKWKEENIALAKENAKKYASEQKERLKSYKEVIKEKVGEKFELKDTFVNKLVELSVAKEEGRYIVDKLYDEYRRDPAKTADLLLFLSDKEEYDRQVSNKKVITSKLETASKIRIRTSPSEISQIKDNDEETVEVTIRK
jgi:hypothetical protein